MLELGKEEEAGEERRGKEEEWNKDTGTGVKSTL